MFNSLGAILAPVYGIMMVDYYFIKKQVIDEDALFSDSSSSQYYYHNGWNRKAFCAWLIGGVFSLFTVWHPSLSDLDGFAWLIGAALGAFLHFCMYGKIFNFSR